MGNIVEKNFIIVYLYDKLDCKIVVVSLIVL